MTFAENTDGKTTELAETESSSNTGEIEEVSISIDDGSQPSEEEIELSNEETKPWVKELRKNQRELQRKNKALEAELIEAKKANVKEVIPTKPTLESCGYDEIKYESEYDTWKDNQREVTKAKETEKQKQEEGQRNFQTKLTKYNEAKTTLKVSDYEYAEDAVKTSLSIVQQGIIIDKVSKPEVLVYAIGKNPKLLETLSKISDPIEFAFEIARTEGKLKVTETKRVAPSPEKTIKGSGNLSSNATDKHLQSLEDEADRTGDRTKVVAYKKTLKNKT